MRPLPHLVRLPTPTCIVVRPCDLASFGANRVCWPRGSPFFNSSERSLSDTLQTEQAFSSASISRCPTAAHWLRSSLLVTGTFRGCSQRAQRPTPKPSGIQAEQSLGRYSWLMWRGVAKVDKQRTQQRFITSKHADAQAAFLSGCRQTWKHAFTDLHRTNTCSEEHRMRNIFGFATQILQEYPRTPPGSSSTAVADKPAGFSATAGEALAEVTIDVAVVACARRNLYTSK